MKSNPKIVFFGAGVIGGSVGAWIAPRYENVWLLDQGEVAKALREKGVTTYLQDHKAEAEKVSVKVINDLAEVPDVDVIVLGVKNYSLEPVAKMIKEKIGDQAVIVSMANGMENQRVLPKFFSRVIYCVVSFNAWMDEPGVIGYQKKGPLVLGTPDNGLQAEMAEVSRVFNLGVETVVTPHLQDAVHSKIVINLTNSLTTLVGFRFREISDPVLFMKLLTGLTSEGVAIVKANGFKECKLGGMPSWFVLTYVPKLPIFLTKPIFDKNVAKMVVSSMTQDVIVRKGQTTELDSINGYIVELADKARLKAPFNRTILELCKREFAKPDFQPLDVKVVWEEVQKRA